MQPQRSKLALEGNKKCPRLFWKRSQENIAYCVWGRVRHPAEVVQAILLRVRKRWFPKFPNIRDLCFAYNVCLMFQRDSTNMSKSLKGPQCPFLMRCNFHNQTCEIQSVQYKVPTKFQTDLWKTLNVKVFTVGADTRHNAHAPARITKIPPNL